jgi:hypothetical protein
MNDIVFVTDVVILRSLGEELWSRISACIVRIDGSRIERFLCIVALVVLDNILLIFFVVMDNTFVIFFVVMDNISDIFFIVMDNTLISCRVVSCGMSPVHYACIIRVDGSRMALCMGVLIVVR